MILRRTKLSDFVMKINRYFDGSSDYPLLVVVPADEYRGLLAAFPNITKIKVSDYCIGADKEPDIERLYEDVKQKTGKYLVLGLGDFLASKSNIAKKTILSYKDLILQQNCRVAILLSS